MVEANPTPEQTIGTSVDIVTSDKKDVVMEETDQPINQPDNQ